MTNNFNYNVFCIGSSGVGKTMFIKRVIFNTFIDYYEPGIEDDFRMGMEIDSNNIGHLSIIDSSHSYEGDSNTDFLNHMTLSIIKNSHGFICVYSIASLASFIEIQQKIELKQIKEKPIILIGNKCDLESLREVSIDQGRQFADSLRIPFFECSAKTGLNAKESVLQLTKNILAQSKIESNQSNNKSKCLIN
eukprot:TRINITY_DN2125_c0_g2_i1.p1 TRINITY_DN2125_c0_g2~~TRINITY_DN2125_c0_g2_i1.p1  ORF type:complete len:192 (+),score=60.19 TRINITY_DN2125_c0_g2_i1:188-763(+)